MNFKDEGEVKEYLKNLGIEYQFGCNQEKKPEVCHLLGDYLEAIKKEFSKAADEYKKNCDERNFAMSCRKFGGYSIVGKGMDHPNPKEGLAYYEKGCELGDSRSCLNQGIVLTTKTNGIPLDYAKGLERLEKSCSMFNDAACHYLSGIYISGIKLNVETDPKLQVHKKPSIDEADIKYAVQKDMNKAFNFAQKACELKNIYACANLSRMYLRGDGVDKNLELSNKFKKIATEIQEEINSKGIEFQRGL